jgi:hypothetical protein
MPKGLQSEASKARKPSGLLTCVPTRNRVENALGLLHTWYDTSTDDDSGLLFVVGTEDPRLEQYKKKIPKHHLMVFPERGIVKAMNYVVSDGYTQEFEAIGFMGDDHRPRTLGWDLSYRRTLQEIGGGFVYGNDLLMGQRIPTQVAISSTVIEAIGHFGNPRFTHLNVDVSWKDLGEACGRIVYLPDVVIEHMHPAASKAEEDEGYKWVNSTAMVNLDNRAYADWKRHDFKREVKSIKDALGTR